MGKDPRRRRSAAPWVFVALLVALAAYGLVTGRLLADEPEPQAIAGSTPAATPTPTPTTPATADIGLTELVAGDVTIADGPFRLESDEDELTAVIRDGLEQAGTPVNDLEIGLVDSTDGGTMTFDAVMTDGNLPLSGEIALVAVDGRLEAEVTEASLAGVPLPGFARGIVEDLVGQATAFGDDLTDQGVVIDSVTSRGAVLSVVGHKDEDF